MTEKHEVRVQCNGVTVDIVDLGRAPFERGIRETEQRLEVDEASNVRRFLSAKHVSNRILLRPLAELGEVGASRQIRRSHVCSASVGAWTQAVVTGIARDENETGLRRGQLSKDALQGERHTLNR